MTICQQAHWRAALTKAAYRACPTVSREEVRNLVDAIIEEIADTLARGEPVKLSRVGTFKLRSKRERIGRNPKTGVEAPITRAAL